ncbi:MAG TPA: alpha/beta hydrolase [Rhizomicrobium sp.]|jgi:pimeloyl-ACP methyl ester carboxylesterase
MKALRLALIALVLPTAASAAPGDGIYARPGILSPAGDGARLNIVCMGQGSPTVVFDSGWEDWAPVWAIVQPRVAKFTRACSYDRAGAGFSDAGPMPRTSPRIADELHTALRNAHIDGPYILVGHAFGGDNVRAFADRYMDDVAGLVMVEADPVDQQSKARQDEDHGKIVPITTELRACRDAVASGKKLPPLTRDAGQTRSCAQQFFRGIPDEDWSPALNARLMRIATTKVALYDAYISEMEQSPWDEDYLRRHVRSFGARPVRVLTTGYHAHARRESKAAWKADEWRYQRDIAQAQAQWLKLSSNARQELTNKSSEYIPFEQPDFVVDAIREVYDARR